MKVQELEHWPVYDTPYEVDDGFGTYTEVIVKGADVDAESLGIGWPEATMVVTEQEWNADHSVRRILRIGAIKRR